MGIDDAWGNTSKQSEQAPTKEKGQVGRPQQHESKRSQYQRGELNRISIFISPELNRQIGIQAIKENCDKSDVVEQVLKKYFEDLE